MFSTANKFNSKYYELLCNFYGYIHTLSHFNYAEIKIEVLYRLLYYFIKRKCIKKIKYY